MNRLMVFESLFSGSVVEGLGWVLVHSLWRFSLVALLAGVTVRSLRRNSSALRYGVLVAALAVWWLSRQIRVEREHCCDDLVVKVLGNRIEYGRALIAIEQLRGRNSVLALGATDGSLLSRVRRIVGSHSERTAPSLVGRWPAVLLGILLIGISGVLSMTWIRAASDDEPETERVTYVATLPNGATIELIGIGFHPAKPEEWWQANGFPLRRDPRDLKLHQIESAKINAVSKRDEYRGFAIRVTGLPTVDIGYKPAPSESHLAYQFDYEPYSEASRYTMVLEPSEFTFVNLSPIPQLRVKTVTLRIGMDESREEEYVRSIGPDGKKLSDDPATAEVQRAEELIQPIRVRPVQNRTELTLKSTGRGRSDFVESVPIAFDKDNHRHDPISVLRVADDEITYLYPVPHDRSPNLSTG